MPGYELIGKEEFEQVKSVFDSGAVLFAHGFESRRNGTYKVREFEKLLTEKFDAIATCCSSGTAALYTALRILNVRPGDYVAIQAYNFIASAEAVIACNAIPIVINIDKSLNMCPVDLQTKMTQYKIGVVIATDMQGNPVDFIKIKAICTEHNSFLVEDACQAIGGKYKGDYLGTIGDVGTFSLDYGKTITTGEGGVIFTRDDDLARQAKAFVDHGHANLKGVDRGEDPALNCGFNFRMSEVQAAIGIAQLTKLEFIVSSYKKNLKIVTEIINSEIGDLVEFRQLNDLDALSDGIIFFMPNKLDPNDPTRFLKERGAYFKNVPAAIKWHSVEHWEHVWQNHPIYYETSNRNWQDSIDLLARAWSFSVNVLDTEEQLKNKSKIIIEAVQKFV